MRVGIDTYSYHRFFGEIREGEEDPGTRWTTWDFLDRAAELGVDGVSLETCYLDLDDPAFRDRLALTLDEAGLEAVLAWGHPGGLEMGRSAERLGDLVGVIDHAAAIGVTLVRLVVGTFTHWGREPPHVSVDRLVPRVQAACRQAAEVGVRLSIETHTALPVEALAELVRRVDAPNLGVVLDTANVVRVGSDLMEATRLLAPLTDMVHMKDLDLSDAGFGDPGGVVAEHVSRGRRPRPSWCAGRTPVCRVRGPGMRGTGHAPARKRRGPHSGGERRLAARGCRILLDVWAVWAVWRETRW